MIIKDYDFHVDKSGNLMNLYCVGDIHMGSEAFLERSFDRLCDIAKKDKNAYFIFTGDITDDDRPSTRLMRRSMFNDRPEALKQEDLQHLAWMDSYVMPRLNKLIRKDRCLGLLDGDHYRQYATGMTSVQYLCTRHKLPYLGSGQAILRLHFAYRGSSVSTVKIHAHHGKGSGVTEEADIRELQRISHQYEGMHLYVRGHSHKPKFVPFTRYVDSMERPPQIKVREGFLVNAGSFRQGVIMNDVDYAEMNLYAPTSTRCPIIMFNGYKPNNYRVELSAVLTEPL